jgi:hypothetical protein
MADKTFTEKQKEIVARKMGYEGPMNMFEKYLNSSPADAQKFGLITEKFMAKGGVVQKYADGGVVKPDAVSVTAAQDTADESELISTNLAPTSATTVTPTAVAPTATVAAVPTTPTATVTTATSTPNVQAAVAGTKAAQGTIKEQDLVTAATMEPTSTAVGSVAAAQGTANQVENAPTRTVQADELVTGTGVDMAKAEATLAKNEAAQGTVTEEMTTQGQLNKLMTDFEVGNPPPWAAASLRNATAQMAARGIGASSLAGQAIIQATLEAATPIASADAAVFQQMGMQNLSNRQQTAILTAQQRAQFLGQEFDQTFQTKVLNAAKISDVANMNFTAQQQVALENARLVQTMDLANLSNRQAVVMAETAQIANLEMSNLNNRQQAAVMNAQAFLQMDMANLANTQQTELFKTQAVVNSILSDTAAENATKQFNASSENQTTQFFANLNTQVKQFNATQTNAMTQFSTEQANTIAKYNADVQNQRDQFNAQNRLVIDQSNAQWRRDISTANTAAINRANEFNATKAQDLTTIEYNNKWQQFRDEIEYSWRSSESKADRLNRIATAEIGANASVLAATMAKDAKLTETLASSFGKILGGTDVAASKGAIGDIWGITKEAASGVARGYDTLYDWATSTPKDEAAFDAFIDEIMASEEEP